VFSSTSLPPEDWAHCLLFAEAVQALHNGAYTRFLAIHLHRRGLLSFRDFYTGLVEFLLADGTDAGAPFRRVQRLIGDFASDPQMPQINRVLTQPDMVEFLSAYNPRRRGWALWTYLWLVLSENKSGFYAAVRRFLKNRKVPTDESLDELFRYQQEIMIGIDYDPAAGKTVAYNHDWFEYFFGRRPLARGRTRLCYADDRMGVSFRYPLVAGDRGAFVNAALGLSYPYSKFRHFFHQPDQTRKLETPGH
jgi:hypothetical protein